ncbi:hypothetical protein ASD30_25050 [Nocardioides sp. Root140]|nr:hypothetical protein ASD30_25050 [Nocardioides sp. Root140]
MQERSNRSRSAVLDAAIALLVERGLPAVTTRSVQQASGLARGGFLHHFPTREALVADVVRELLQRRAHRAEIVIAEMEMGAPGDRISAAIRAGSVLFSGPDFLAEQELWTAARTDPALRDALAPVVGWLDAKLAEQLPRLFGEEAAANPRFPLVAELSVNLLVGLAVTAPITGLAGREALVDQWCEIVRPILGVH